MLFAEAQPETGHLITLTTISSIVIGLVVWILRSALPAMLKQHRDDIFQLHKECTDEREAAQARHDAAMEKKEEQLQRVIDNFTAQLKRP